MVLLFLPKMDELIFIDSDSKESSIIELEVPKRKSPPLIEVEDVEDIILNVKGKQNAVEFQADVIKMDSHLNNIESNNNEKKLSKNGQKNKLKNHYKDELNNSQKKVSSQFQNPSHWTSDMIKFYNEDWGNEKDFSVEKIQRKMDKNPSLWEISGKDIFFMHNRSRKSYVRCTNCGQHGHRFFSCPEPPYVPKCYMCGMSGHLENSCPNSICLNCGCKTHHYKTFCPSCEHESERVCARCLMRGHHFINCTDHWRLFHLTTNQNNIRTPKKYLYKNEKDVWCCNCGRQGHYLTYCPCRKDCAVFMDTYPFVASYENTFNVYFSSKNRYRESQYSHEKNLKNNQLVFKNLNNIPKSKKRNVKAENLFKFNPLNNISRREPIKKKKKKNKKKKKRKVRQENTSFFIQENKVILPLGL